MTYAQFQQHFEQTAEAEANRFDSMPVAELIAEINASRFGRTYQIWYSLAKRASPDEVNALFLAFLDSNADYLQRYHCAAALIQVNQLAKWQPHELSAAPKFPVADNLKALKDELGAV
jgi:hypothetical protein